jgi:phosphinothricin acetyltransferase
VLEVREIRMKILIRGLDQTDWPSVRDIYHQGILTGLATFETDLPEWEEWNQAHRREPRLVAVLVAAPEKAPAAHKAEKMKEVIGWAAVSPVSGRCVYDGVGEVSAYVAASYRGRGVGHALMEALVEQSEAAGIWTLEAGIFPENEASLAIHERSGFRKVGVRQRLGQLNGVWRDVILLERRSEKVG